MKKIDIKRIFVFYFLVIAGFVILGCTKNKMPTISFEEKEITISVGGEFELVPIIKNLTGEDLVEYSFDTQGIIIYTDGKFVSLKTGVVTITASLKGYQDINFTIKVIVEKVVIVINGDNMMSIGEKQELTVTTFPFNVPNINILWSSSDPEIITVNDEGIVSALKSGYASIKAFVKDESSIFGTFLIYVQTTLIEQIVLNGEEKMRIGEMQILETSISPSNATNRNIIWSSSNPQVATVSNGLVSALNTGTTIIKALASDTGGVEGVFTIVVEGILVTTITIQGLTAMYNGIEQQLTANVLPTNAQNKNILWSSSDPTIATVDGGIVKALSNGRVEITALAADGSGVEDVFIVEIFREAIYVSSKLSNMFTGEKVTYQGFEYTIGQNAFSTIKSGLEKANEVILIGEGTYDESIDITKSGITFIGNGQTSVIIRLVRIIPGVKDITFDNLIFTNAGGISVSEYNLDYINGAPQENITIKNCLFYDLYQPSIIYFSNDMKNFYFIDNQIKASNCFRFIHFTKSMENLTIIGNHFEDSGDSVWDHIRGNGVLFGKVNISNNVFISSRQSAIFFDYHGSGEYKINNNEFYKINNVAIDIRTTNEVFCTSKFEIMGNVFDNSERIYNPNYQYPDMWAPIRFRANNYTSETLSLTINYNIFIGWGNLFLENASNYPLICTDMNCNYFDLDGPLSSENFDGIAFSWDNRYDHIADVPKYNDALVS